MDRIGDHESDGLTEQETLWYFVIGGALIVGSLILANRKEQANLLQNTQGNDSQPSATMFSLQTVEKKE